MNLYKYRSLDSWEFLLDILINSRLYAATFNSLNDPMEGHFRYKSSHIGYDLIEEIKHLKKQTRICSLSKTYYNDLLWAYYAGGHSGVVIDVTPNDMFDTFDVDYSGLASIRKDLHSTQEIVREILTKKDSFWIHEEEARILSEEQFIPVTINKVILGRRISPANKSLVKKLLKKLDIQCIEYKNL